MLTFTFTFMHLADTFIQSDLYCIQVTVSKFDQLLLSLGLIASGKATGKLIIYICTQIKCMLTRHRYVQTYTNIKDTWKL